VSGENPMNHVGPIKLSQTVNDLVSGQPSGQKEFTMFVGWHAFGFGRKSFNLEKKKMQISKRWSVEPNSLPSSFWYCIIFVPDEWTVGLSEWN